MYVNKEDFYIEYVEDIDVIDTNNDYSYMLFIHDEEYETKLVVVSKSKLVRAVELLEFLISEFGLVRGDATRASGYISKAILNSLISDRELSNAKEYFEALIEDYLIDTAFIMAYDFVAENEDFIRSLPLYAKRKVKWAVVKSTDIIEAGKQFIIKSLENESGELITASENSYIMIGCRGEIYEIYIDKFNRSYEMSDEKLDVFEQMLDFIPEVRIKDTGEFVAIDELAHICYPKQDAKIYAIRLKGRTKLFQRDGDGEYFLGRKDDYMAVRADDISDMYIIQRDVFEYTYEMI